MTGPTVPVAVATTAGVTPTAAFAAIVPVDLTRIFTGFGPLPAVRRVRDQSGPWDHAGATRTVELSDGTTVTERLTAVVPGEHFSYRVGPFSGPLGRLVRHADGDWWFGPARSGTAVRWRYTFQARGRVTGVVVAALVVPLWRRYAERALAAAVALAEGRTDA